MTARRLSPIWSLLPLIVGLLLMTLSVFGALELKSLAGLCLLTALPISGLLLFGGFQRRYWLGAVILTLIVVSGGVLFNAWLTVQLLMTAGEAGPHMTETMAALLFLGAGVAVISALATGLVCGLGWLRRPIAPPLP